MWGIELHRQSEVSLKRQIYQALRTQMLNGGLQAGEALPSTRTLADALDVSRTTVNEAYDMLIAEGYAISRQGSPTRVAEGLCLSKAAAPARAEQQEPANPAVLADFRTGQPDLRQVPRYLWQQLAHKALSDIPLEQWGYSGPQGLPGLRGEIAAWLRRSKGLHVDPGDIFITAGATHALHLIAGLLQEEEKPLLLEDPCNRGMLQTFLNQGYPVVPLPADESGLQTDELHGQRAGAVYVTPSHQFPLGGILPAGRRAALIRFARDSGSYIIEDDYDSEFRYYGEPIAPLYALDAERVIHVGTFSKVLFPALRIGYVILPRELQPRWKELRTYTDVQNPPFEQAALAELLRSRKFDAHLRKMRKLYGDRRQTLLAALESQFGSGWRAWGDAAGLHLAVEFPGVRFDEAMMETGRRLGIRAASVEEHCVRKGIHISKLLLGYGHLTPEEIGRGVSRLYQWIKANG